MERGSTCFAPRPLRDACSKSRLTIRFAAGHYLRNYKGKCENPHGHNYKIRVTLAGAELDKAGLLLDFKDLREVMKHVIERLDHQMINDIEPFTVINPSAENLAKYFYDESNTRLKSVTERPRPRKRRDRVRDRYDNSKIQRVVAPLSSGRPARARAGDPIGFARAGYRRYSQMQIAEIYKSIAG